MVHRADVGGRGVPVDRLDLAAHGRLQSQRVNRRAQEPVLIVRQPDHAVFVNLMDGQVDVKRGLAVQAEVLDVSDHAHNLDGSRALIVVIDAQMRAERAAVRPVPPGETLADEHYRRGLRGVVFVEFAPGDQRNLHGAEITGARYAIVRHPRFIRRRSASLDGEINAGQGAAQGQHGDEADGLDSGQSLEAWPQLVIERRDCDAAGVACLRQRKPDGQHVLRVEAGTDRLQSEKALDEQAGADQQHQRDRDFRDDQQAPRATLPRPADRSAPVLLELFAGVHARGLPGRGQTEDQPGHERKREGEPQHSEIHADFAGARQGRRAEREKQGNAMDGEQQPRRAAEQGKQHALGCELLNQTSARGAERRADGHLPVTRRGPHERQVRQIDAGDQEHRSDGPEQYP